MARGCCTARASNDTPPGRPPFGGQGSLCASSLHAALYTLLPLRGISPQGETRECATAPCPIGDGESTKHRFPLRPLRWQGNLIRRESKTTENQVTRFPPGRRGPRSGAGCCTARASNDTPPQAGRRLAVRAALRFISTRGLVHPFAATRHFPSRGNKELSRRTLRPLQGERATKWRGGVLRQEPQMILHPGRPPFGGQSCLCASSLHAASYTLLPLRGISPQGETRDGAAFPRSIGDGESTKH